MADVIKLEREINTLAGFTEIVRKFVQRLGDPSKFEYRGECIDLGGPVGKCTCDHPIRYVFLIHGPDGRVAPVGSECINHFASYNPNLYERLTHAKDALFEKLAQEEKDRAEALRRAELDEVKPAFDAALARFRTFIADYKERTQSYFLPYDLYALQGKLNRPPEYKRTQTYTKYYKDMAEHINQVLARHEKKVA